MNSSSISSQTIAELPFTIRVATTYKDLIKAVEIRSQAYGRHIPDMGSLLSMPEIEDYRHDIIILIAESKLNGSMLGSMRLQSNFTQPDIPLKIENELKLPNKLTGKRSIECMRLGVKNGSEGKLITTSLAKATLIICQMLKIELVFVAARKPVDKLYRSMLFQDVTPGEMVRLSYANLIPHYILYFSITELIDKVNHPLYGFLFNTVHPDIQIDYSLVSNKFGLPPH